MGGALVDVGSKAPAILPARVRTSIPLVHDYHRHTSPQYQSLTDSHLSTFIPFFTMYLQEVSINPADKMQDLVHLDEEMEFQVISDGDEDGAIMLSLKRIQYEK